MLKNEVFEDLESKLLTDLLFLKIQNLPCIKIKCSDLNIFAIYLHTIYIIQRLNFKLDFERCLVTNG